MNIPIDQQDLFAIELPGISSPDANLQNILKRFNKNALLQAATSSSASSSVDYWNGEDHFRKPTLTGNILRCKKIIIRLKRDASGNVSVLFTGFVRKICIFRCLADFSMQKYEFSNLNYSIGKIPLLAESLNIENVDKCVDLFLDERENDLISSFLPTTPRYSQYSSGLNMEQRKPTKEYTGKRNSGISLFERAPWVISYSDSGPIPMASMLEEPLRGIHKDVLVILRKLLDERPIWVRTSITYALEQHIKRKDINGILTKLLPHVCYNYSKGPWRRCWIRYGYDPRQHQQSRLYQTVIMKNVYWNQHEANSNVIQKLPIFSKDKPHVFDGQTVSNNLATFQLCDITEPSCKLLIDGTCVDRLTPSESDGWYPDEFIRKLRQLMSTKLELLLKDVNWSLKPRTRFIIRRATNGQERALTKKSGNDTSSLQQLNSTQLEEKTERQELNLLLSPDSDSVFDDSDEFTLLSDDSP